MPIFTHLLYNTIILQKNKEKNVKKLSFFTFFVISYLFLHFIDK